MLILLHIGACLTMGIGFRNNYLLLGLLFVASSFVRRWEGWGGLYWCLNSRGTEPDKHHLRHFR